jgi:hypothetical protein
MVAAKIFEQGPLRLIQQFINERGHGAISSDKQCSTGGLIDPGLLFLAHKLRSAHCVDLIRGNALNPQIKEMLDRVGFVFNVTSWITERTVGLMEEYCANGADINTVPSNTEVREYKLGKMIIHWKWNGAPGWMERPELKRRLDAIGFDLSLNSVEVKFIAKCRELKTWKEKHGNPLSGGKKKGRSSEETSLYKFRWNCLDDKYLCMRDPKLKRHFLEAEAVKGT